MTQSSDELREELRKNRVKNGRQRKIGVNTDSGISDTSNHSESNSGVGGPQTQSGNGPEERPSDNSSGPLQHFIGTVRGRTDNDQGHDQPATNAERELAGRTGSTTQVNRRVRPDNRRSGENSTEDQSVRVNVREGSSSVPGTINPPIHIGNLERNIEDEKSILIPSRFFDNTQPIVGEPALIISKEGQPVKREGAAKGIKKDGTRAVETLKAVIPKAKRGRPATKSVYQNAETTSADRKENILTKAVKQAGQAIPNSKKLDQREIEELREPLTQALKDEFGMFDQLLWKYEGEQSLQQPIWSDVHDSEMDKLVNALLNMGTRSATVATIARASVDLSDYIIAGTLLAPRLQSTAALVGEVRKRKAANRPPRSTRGRRF